MKPSTPVNPSHGRNNMTYIPRLIHPTPLPGSEPITPDDPRPTQYDVAMGPIVIGTAIHWTTDSHSHTDRIRFFYDPADRAPHHTKDFITIEELLAFINGPTQEDKLNHAVDYAQSVIPDLIASFQEAGGCDAEDLRQYLPDTLADNLHDTFGPGPDNREIAIRATEAVL